MPEKYIDNIKLAAVVVLYNPVMEKIKRNIKSYLNEVDSLLLIDNSDFSVDIIKSLGFITDKISYIRMEGNEGIAKALNTGVKRCIDNGYEWVLTMDQDSLFLTSLKPYRDYIMQVQENSTALLCPSYYLEENKKVFNSTTPYSLDKVVQSGNLINTHVFQKTGYFEEKYFIDYVDYDYCMRINKIGAGKITCIPTVVLNHRPGDKSKGRFLFFTYNYIGQSPLRYYYSFRNGLDYMIRYKDYPHLLIFVKSIGKLVLQENQKIKKSYYLLCGIKDYFLKNWGKKDIKNQRTLC